MEGKEPGEISAFIPASYLEIYPEGDKSCSRGFEETTKELFAQESKNKSSFSR
jgi:hypothetical protein